MPASSLKNVVYVDFIYENIKFTLEVSTVTVQSFYNTPCYNTDLDITKLYFGSHFFSWIFTKK